MIKKPVKRKLSYYQNKADRLLQEVGKKTQEYCEVCGQPMSCLHHFFPKSMAAILRYNLKNCVALCQGCHLRHHCGDPTIHATIISQRGEEWLEDLKLVKREYFKPSKSYYEYVIDRLETILK